MIEVSTVDHISFHLAMYFLGKVSLTLVYGLIRIFRYRVVRQTYARAPHIT